MVPSGCIDGPGSSALGTAGTTVTTAGAFDELASALPDFIGVSAGPGTPVGVSLTFRRGLTLFGVVIATWSIIGPKSQVKGEQEISKF